MANECATTEFLAVRKYGEISGKPLHFARYKYVLAVENMAKFSKNRHISEIINISCKVSTFDRINKFVISVPKILLQPKKITKILVNCTIGRCN